MAMPKAGLRHAVATPKGGLPNNASTEHRLEILLAMHEYNACLARQYFDYRDRITASALLVYAGLASVIVSLSFAIETVLVSVFMAVMAHFCRFFVLKFYERSEYHHSRCRVIRDCLDATYLGDGVTLAAISEQSMTQHNTRFFIRGSRRLRNAAMSANTHDHWAWIHRLFFYAALAFAALITAKAGIDAVGLPQVAAWIN